MKLRKIISLLIVVTMLVSVMASCGGGGSDSASNQVSVSAPANVAVDEKGLVTWDKVDNATAYYVFYGDKKTIVTEESFLLQMREHSPPALARPWGCTRYSVCAAQYPESYTFPSCEKAISKGALPLYSHTFLFYDIKLYLSRIAN